MSYLRATLAEGLRSSSRAGERGQGMVEYAFILVFVAMVVIVVITLLGHQVNNVFSNISNGLSH